MDILTKQYPHKIETCKPLFDKENLSAIDILELNKKIFGITEEPNQKYRSYDKSDILKILDYQKMHNLNNTQVSNHFKLSRNTVAKWKKIFLV